MVCPRGGSSPSRDEAMNHERRDSERPNDWLFDKLNTMSEAEVRHYNELRSRIDSLLIRLDDHSGRILVMETTAEHEKDVARKTAGFQSTGIGVLLIAAWEVFKRGVLGWK